MKTTDPKQKNYRIQIFSLLFLFSIEVVAQSGVNVYADLGTNNVSHGLFIKSAVLGNYKFGKNRLETGIQTDLKNYNKHIFSGYKLDASRDFMIKGILTEIHGFYTTTISSGIIRESNIGGMFRMRFNHFEMTLGTNLRTFSLRQSGIIVYENQKNTSKMHEAGNFMYSFGYNLKPAENRWNAGITLTNFDHFMINQETNPMINLHGSYKMNSPASLYAQAWYKIAGASNLEVNYFGFYLKTGLLWNF